MLLQVGIFPFSTTRGEFVQQSKIDNYGVKSLVRRFPTFIKCLLSNIIISVFILWIQQLIELSVNPLI